MIFIYSISGLIIVILLVFFVKLLQLNVGNKKVTKELVSFHYNKLDNLGSVKSLSVLPLVDFYTDNPKLKTEPGVSYLVKTDNTNILMDTGFNKHKEHPSPLLHNMKTLGLSANELDLMFISHLHLDHVGGMREQKKGEFSISKGIVDLPAIPVYAPVNISPSHLNPGPKPKVIKEPVKLKNGIASIGAIPRNLFIMGYTLENSLAINVENKGIVLIVGCGHQTIERIIERASNLFDEPIYGIIGGLHFPVKFGRIMLGPLNIQNMFGSEKPPWKGIKEEDIKNALNAIKKVNPQFVALSPHDSSDWSIEQFRKTFKDKYHDLKVGKEMRI